MRPSTLFALLALFIAVPSGAQLACVGDCNLDASVTIDEVLLGVSIVLGLRTLQDCAAMDPNNDDAVSIDELVRAVDFALHGCPPDEQVCGSAQDCPQSFPCLAPGEFRGCGICHDFETDCTTDSACKSLGSHYICAPVPETDCPCSFADVCQPGCRSRSDCRIGEECNSVTNRCEPRTCTNAPSVCPPLFGCLPGSPQSICLRLACYEDGDCRGAYCVNGQCYAQPGFCSPPVP